MSWWWCGQRVQRQEPEQLSDSTCGESGVQIAALPASCRLGLGLGQVTVIFCGSWVKVDLAACNLPTPRRGSSPPGYAHVCMRVHARVNVCVVCSLFQYVPPSRTIFLCCNPVGSPQPLHRSRGRQPPLLSPPHGAFFPWWTHRVGPPQVLVSELWLRVQPAMFFRAGPGESGANG